MDPAVGATIFTVLLYLLSSHSAQPPQQGRDTFYPQPSPPAVEITKPNPHAEGNKPGAMPQSGDGWSKNGPGNGGATLPVPGSAMVSSDRVNLRRGPGTNYSKITTLKRGTQLNLIASHEGWYQVRLKDGRVGWAFGSLLSGPGAPPVQNPSSSPAVAPARRSGQVEVLAYFAQNYPGDPAPRRSLDYSRHVLDGVVMFSYFMDEQGNIVGQNPDDITRQLKASDIDAYALIHNYRGSGFDQGVVHTVLRSESLRLKAIRQILNILDQEGFRGVNIDFENVHPGDRGYLTKFMQELSSMGKARGKEVTISVPAKSKDMPGAAWFGAFDYYALGRVADKVMIMTYDEHSTVSGPGPIASINWVREVIS
ncbi:MAG TPA: SH3 domain-containing protein, partial [Firmicutes bacterium]|nr:SH3 domain-containing protein [Bacillota bacterium]